MVYELYRSNRLHLKLEFTELKNETKFTGWLLIIYISPSTNSSYIHLFPID
jgi:hypothetical protein